MSLITAENIIKKYGDTDAVSGASLELNEGEILGVLGPNGAGKSTLVKVLTGQTDRDSGKAEVLGMDPEDEPKKLKEKLGVLPEREDPPSFLTGREYLDMISEVREEEIDKEKWKEKLNLEGKMDKQIQNLSKGERQKFMIIQAFFHEPELVFVDEPLINLDPVVQEEVKDLFKERKDNGKSILLCTHVISLAEEVCDRAIFLKDGEDIELTNDMENLKGRFLEEE